MTNSSSGWRKSAALALGRWALGIQMCVAGFDKLSHYGDISAFAEGFAKPFGKTFLPVALVKPYAVVLGPLELALGALLLLGFWRDLVVFATALVMVTLAFGMMAQAQWVVVALNVIYVFLLGYLLQHGDADTWVVGRRR